MEIWLETSQLPAVQHACDLGVLHGVATNPSMARTSVPFDELLQSLLSTQKGPVAAQVIGTTAQEIIQQSEALYSFSPRIMVKIPVTREGLKAIFFLSQKKIPIMANGIFSSNQALLAARIGTQYIAPCFSGICEADPDGMADVRTMAQLIEKYRYPCKIIATSLQSTEQIKECYDLGMDAVALSEVLFEEYIADHPLTIKDQNRFCRDWKKASPRKNLPF